MGFFCSEFLKTLRFLHTGPVTIEQEVRRDASAPFVNEAQCDSFAVFSFPNIQRPSGSFLEAGKGEPGVAWAGWGMRGASVNDVRSVHSCLVLPGYCQSPKGRTEPRRGGEEEAVWRM